MTSLAFVFPGQGSQAVGMLAAAQQQFSGVTETFVEASDALGYDLWQLIQDGPAEQLNQTDVTQPAILTASIALWRAWLAESGPQPQFVAGHSLGEYSALVAAGVLPFADTVKLVRLRGELMQQAVPLGTGAMAAILGLDDAAVVTACAESADQGVVAAVNFNAPGQVVIAGEKAAVDAAIAACKADGAKRAMALPVSVPSHCALMKPAAEKLSEALADLTFSEPQIPVVQNVNAEINENVTSIRQDLLQQLYSPVQWSASVTYMVEQGVTRFVECGPGKVLAGLGKRIKRDAEQVSIEDPDKLRNAVVEFNA